MLFFEEDIFREGLQFRPIGSLLPLAFLKKASNIALVSKRVSYQRYDKVSRYQTWNLARCFVSGFHEIQFTFPVGHRSPKYTIIYGRRGFFRICHAWSRMALPVRFRWPLKTDRWQPADVSLDRWNPIESLETPADFASRGKLVFIFCQRHSVLLYDFPCSMFAA